MGKLSPVLTDNLNKLEYQTLQAIKTTTIDFQPFSICLSGGVDSSLLLAMLCNLNQKPTLTVTLANSPDHPDYQAAKIVAKLFDVAWYPVIRKTAIQIPTENRVHVITGDDAVYTLFTYLAHCGVKNLLCTEGIDELTGGYQDHKTEKDFTYFLGRLWSFHLEPLLATANHFHIRLRFPFLDYQLADFITKLPLELKTKEDSRKILWRELALKYLPEEIVYRRKYGQCSMLTWRPE